MAGPPTTPQETKRFNQQVEKEQQEIQSAILQAKAQDGDIQQVANSNCADLALDWHMCMKDMSLERLTTMCAAKHVAYLNCQKLQRRNLQRLGYGRLILTDDEKDLIIGKADKMYLQEMDAERQKDA